MYDLLLKGGRVIDPAQGLDATLDVGFLDGHVAAIAADLGTQARMTRNVAGRIVTPGLIDMHSHVYWGATSLGVDAETIAKRSGTTTFVDAGSAGAGNFAGLRKFIVEPAAPRILAYLNISFPGIFGFSKNVMVGECEGLRLLDSRECLALAEKNLDLIVGIKARVGAKAGGNSGLASVTVGDRSGRRTRSAGHGAYRFSAARSQRGARGVAPRRCADALLPPVSECAGHARQPHSGRYS